MARTSKKNVYEKIEDKKFEIAKTEELLETLNAELQVLYAEKDDLEMHQLLDLMKSNGLNIEQAVSLLNKK